MSVDMGPYPGTLRGPRTSVGNVVLAIGQLHAGGTEGQLVQLALGLRDRGIRVAVATLFDRGVHSDALEAAGVEVYFAGFPEVRRNPGSAWRLIPAFMRYVRWLRAQRPQVVQMFLYHAYAITAPAARLARIRVIVGGRRSLSNFKQGRCVALAWERVVNALTTHFVANCRAVADDAIRTERIAPARMSVILNGLPPQHLLPATPIQVQSGNPVVACVANLRKYKGHHDLLAAMDLLHRDGKPFTLLLAGEGELEEKLRRDSEAMGLDVRFLGSVRNVAEVLAAADIAVLPSHHEGLSNSVLEAMAAGRAVVATAVGGTPEMLDGCGVLVPPQEPRALAEALGHLLDNPDEAEALGRAARERVAAHFTINSMIDRYVDLYEELI